MDKDQVVGHLFEETCPAVIITDNGLFVVKLTTGPPGHKMAQRAPGPDSKTTVLLPVPRVIMFLFVEFKYPTTRNYSLLMCRPYPLKDLTLFIGPLPTAKGFNGC